MSWIPRNLTELCSTTSTASICQPNNLLFLQLVYTIFGSQKVSKKPTNAIKTPDQFDFIIVGAGSAGCILANRLTEIRKWNVLLLEAGIEEPSITNVPAFPNIIRQTNIDWNYKTQPDNNACLAGKGCQFSSGKVMGGSSSINGMLYVRGNRKDYDKWEDLGNRGWGYDNVLRYFKKTENNRDEQIVDDNSDYHGTKGYQSVAQFTYTDKNSKIILKALEKRGYKSVDVNARKQLGSMNLQTTSFDGKRQSSNNAFIRPIRNNRPNLFIETQAYVTNIIIDPKTKKTLGVEYTTTSDNKKKVVRAKKEVIVSAGVIKSPQLLMVSGIGPAEDLQKHNIKLIYNASVGLNFHDHVLFNGLYILLDNKTATETTFKQKKADLEQYLKTQNGPLSAQGTVSISAFVQTKYEESEGVPDIQFCFAGTSIGNNDSSPVLAYYDSLLFSPILLAPKSKGYIKLNDTDPVWGSPFIYPRYFADDIDLNRMVEGIRMGLRLFDTEYFEENNFKLHEVPQSPCNNLKFSSDEYWTCLLRTKTVAGNHGVGTCKMGTDVDPDAVVDSRLRVYGVKRLRVVDSSIMPVIPRGNTNAPTMMIAEKASDMIKEDWLKD